jgi:hypothetical protein
MASAFSSPENPVFRRAFPERPIHSIFTLEPAVRYSTSTGRRIDSGTFTIFLRYRNLPALTVVLNKLRQIEG